MKKHKLLGAAMIVAALSLQVSYAAVYNYDSMHTVGNQQYDAAFGKVELMGNGTADYLQMAETRVNDKATEVAFSISNLYPGAGFTLKPEVQNYGRQAIKVKSIKVEQIASEPSDDQLYAMLKGIDGSENKLDITAYNEYLKNELQGTVIGAGKSQEFALDLMMDEAVTDMKNTGMAFRLVLDYEQAQEEPEATDSPSASHKPVASDSSSSSHKPVASDSSSSSHKPVATDNPSASYNPSATESSSAAQSPSMTVSPLPSAQPSEGVEALSPQSSALSQDASKVQSINHEVPSEKGFLPKTGGMISAVIYIGGAGLLLGGIALCRKKDDK